MDHERKITRLYWTAILALLSLACGLIPQPTPTLPAPTATVTLPPATATAEPQVTFTAHEEPALGLEFRYPDSWELQVDEDSVVVASDVELLTAEQFDRDGAGTLIVVGGRDAFEGATLEDALNTAILQYQFTDNDRIVEGPRPVTINGQEGVTAVVEGSNSGDTRTLVVLVTMLRSGDRSAFVAGVTLQEFLDQYRQMLETVTQSVVLSELETAANGDRPSGNLRYGETVEGRLQPGERVSWTFIGVEGERIDLTVRPLQETLDVIVDVQDAQGASILPSGPVDDSFGVELIRGLTLPTSAQFTIIISGLPQASGDYELAIGEAGGLSSAQSIAVGDTLNGSLEADEQEDYLFVAPGQSAVTVIVNPVGDLDIVLEVLDSEGGILYQEDSSYGQEQLTFTPSAGDYVLRVRGFAGAGGDYAISLQAGGVGGAGTTLVTSGTLEAGDEEGHDFPFTTNQGEIVQAVVSPDGDFDLVVEIWNDDSDEMEESIDASFGREQVNFTTTLTGNYYFKVLGFEGQGGSYTITLSGSPEVIFELLPGDQITGDMGESSHIDYYIRLEANEAIHINVVPDSDTDVVAELLDFGETALSSVDDGFAGESEALSYTAPSSQSEEQVFIVRIRNFSEESGGTFTMTLE